MIALRVRIELSWGEMYGFERMTLILLDLHFCASWIHCRCTSEDKGAVEFWARKMAAGDVYGEDAVVCFWGIPNALVCAGYSWC